MRYKSLYVLPSPVFTSASPLLFGANAVKLVHFVTLMPVACYARANRS